MFDKLYLNDSKVEDSQVSVESNFRSLIIMGYTIIIMVIFKCYFFGEHIALSIKNKTTTTV